MLERTASREFAGELSPLVGGVMPNRDTFSGYESGKVKNFKSPTKSLVPITI
jgi:hypothetical protein